MKSSGIPNTFLVGAFAFAVFILFAEAAVSQVPCKSPTNGKANFKLTNSNGHGEVNIKDNKKQPAGPTEPRGPKGDKGDGSEEATGLQDPAGPASLPRAVWSGTRDVIIPADWSTLTLVQSITLLPGRYVLTATASAFASSAGPDRAPIYTHVYCAFDPLIGMAEASSGGLRSTNSLQGPDTISGWRSSLSLQGMATVTSSKVAFTLRCKAVTETTIQAANIIAINIAP